MNEWKARAHTDFSMNQFELFLRGHNDANQGFQMIPENIIFNTVSIGMSTSPFLQGEEGLAILQALVDAAFEYGIVPHQLEDHRSELKATKEHLQDMRKLTFSILEVKS